MKHREVVGAPYGYTLSSGLYNSANFINEMLQRNGVTSQLVEVVDNNSIDKVVTQFNPDIVVIEAYWVVPEKFDVLHKLHPNVKWIIRVHSEVPFLAGEGIAIDWTKGYFDRRNENVSIAFNSRRTRNDIAEMLEVQYPDILPEEIDQSIVYLPNYYPITKGEVKGGTYQTTGTLNCGLFGAIRPMKNQLIQAMAALEFADENGYNLNLHINTSRIERGEEAYKNLLALFDGLDSKYQLIQHEWLDHEDFITLVRQMDIGLQVSFSETFNIVAADFVDNGVPVVVSNQIRWVSKMFYADPTKKEDITAKMKKALNFKNISPIDINKKRLKKYCIKSRNIWLDIVNR